MAQVLTAKFLQSIDDFSAFVGKHGLIIAFGAVYAVLSVYVMLHFMHASLLGDAYYRTQFETMVDGTAWKPFVYRVLIPKLVRIITWCTPEFMQDDIDGVLYGLKDTAFGAEMGVLFPWIKVIFYRSGLIYPRLVATLLIYGFLWGYIIAMYKFGRALFPDNTAIGLFAPIFGLLAIPSFSVPYQYVYDIPLLFLSAMCFYTMFTRRFGLYLCFFFLACLNKESSIFIALFFILWFYKKLPTSDFLALCAAQFCIYATIKIVLTFIYIKNAGWILEHNLFKVVNWDLMTGSSLHKILSIVVFFFVLVNGWREKPLFLKYAFWIFPAIYVCYMFFGNPGEYRVFFDIFPLLVLLGTHTLIGTTGIASARVFQPSDRS